MHRNGHYRIWDQKYLKRRGKTNTVRLMHMVEHPLEISIGSPNHQAVRNHSGVVVLPREGLDLRLTNANTGCPIDGIAFRNHALRKFWYFCRKLSSCCIQDHLPHTRSAVREPAFRLTITTSVQDGSAASVRTTAAPTCPVPPMIKTRNAILGLFSYRPYATCHSARAGLAKLQPFSATYKIALI